MRGGLLFFSSSRLDARAAPGDKEDIMIKHNFKFAIGDILCRKASINGALAPDFGAGNNLLVIGYQDEFYIIYNLEKATDRIWSWGYIENNYDDIQRRRHCIAL